MANGLRLLHSVRTYGGLPLIEELDLLSSIAGKGGEGKSRGAKRAKFEASIIATYNAYLPFYEEVVLRRLVSSGCQYNVLLLDSGDLSQSLTAPTAQPRLAGRAYTLVPMQAAGAFHPKVALLVGKNSTRVFIGSHNVTLSGFGHNREITTKIELAKGSDDPDVPLARAVWKFLDVWLRHQGDYLPQSIINAAQKVATTFAPWLWEESAQSGDAFFLGTDPSGDSLWTHVRPLLPEKAKQVIVIGPFFDRAGGFLKTLARDLQTDDIVVGVEPDSVELCRQEDLPNGVRFVDASSLGRGKDKGYLHAKGLSVQGEDGEIAMVTGSANPSNPAWTEVPKKRNAEAVMVHLGNSARNLAETLGITSLPTMPDLGKDALEAIVERVAQTKGEQKKPSTAIVLAAEALEKEILLHGPGLLLGKVKEIRCWEYGHNNWLSPQNISSDNRGLHLEMKNEDVAKIGFLEIELTDGHQIHALVHHPASIARLNRTSNQRRFQEALNGLESGSPDLPTLIRLASNLIFDEEITSAQAVVRGQRKKEKEGEEPDTLAPLSVSIEESRQHRKRVRELRGSDLAYIIDTLIYRLGLSLKTSAEQLEETGPSEEEQIGKEDEVQPTLVELPKTDIEVIQRKVKTLVNRMIKQLGKKASSSEQTHRPVEQLLAVLAVMREIRAQDRRYPLTEGQSLAPLEYRKQLLEGSIVALFGRKRKLFDSFTMAFEKDPEEDVSRLLGLLWWLAYDSGIDTQYLDIFPMGDPEQTHERLLNLAKLLEIAIASGDNNEAFKEAEHSICRTVPKTTRGVVSKWIAYHLDWSRELSKMLLSKNSWVNARSPQVADIGIAIREATQKLRLISGFDDRYIHFVEFGNKHFEIKFLRDKVISKEMPIISEKVIGVTH